MAAQFTGRAAAPAAPQATARPGCLPPPPPTQTVAEDQHSQVTPAPHKRVRWTIVLAGVLVLLAGTLAAKRINFYRPPAVASYNTRLAELDSKLSRALAGQLRAAGYEFDAVIVNVEGPACQRAVCLVKELRRGDLMDLPGRVAGHHAGDGTWSFAGMGQLAGAEFEVDATTEMRRLLKSTPPEFPQAPLAAVSGQLSERRPVAAVGQEITILLTSTALAERRQWLDFEGVRCLEEPDWDYFGHARSYLDWCRTNALDLSAVFDSDQSYWLFASAMAVAPVAGKLWEQGTPEDIISHPALRSIQPLLGRRFPPARDPTQTYLFRTREGTIGVLQVLEFNPASRQLKIQYKLAHMGTKADV